MNYRHIRKYDFRLSKVRTDKINKGENSNEKEDTKVQRA